jgi:hydroxymethylbilane synthase
MKFDGFIKEVLPPQEFLYPPGQGIIAVETRIGSDAEKIAQLVNDKKSEFIGMIEREIVKNIGGGCNSPFGICTELKEVEKKEKNGNNKEDKIFFLYLKFEAFERNIIFEDEFKITSLDKEQINDIVSHILSRLKR